MADRPGEAVQPDHDQGFTDGDVAQQARQHRPAAVGARRMLLEDGGAACCVQVVELRVGALVLVGDPRIGDEAGGL